MQSSDFGELVKAHGYVKARQLLKRVAVEKHQSNISEKERAIHKFHEPQRIRESTLLSTTSGNIASYPVLDKLLLGNRALHNFEADADDSSRLSLKLIQQIQKHEETKISKDNFLSSHEIQYSLQPHSNLNLLISNQSISHLPIELCDTMYLQLGYLQQMNLTRNCLGGMLHSSLSSLSMYHFRYIKKLNLSFNNLRRLPDNIGVMECLEECNLSNNYLSTLPKSFTSLKSLLKLNLANNNFAKMFEEMNYLNCLTELNLSNNLFMNFPYSVTKLPALKKLVFNYNAISHLAIFPPLLTIEDMWKPIVDRYNGKTVFLNILTREKVSHIECYEGRGLQYQYDLNQFQSSHYSNRKYYFRRKLWLNSCNIPEYESDVDGFSGQTFFRNNVSGDTTWEIPPILDSLSSLSNLLEVHIISNALKQLPNSILKITLLTKLVLTKNRISNLPEEIHQLTLLQYLDISTNEIKSLPNNIVFCKNLQELIVTDNHLLYLPETIGDELNKCLFRLDVSVNRLSHLPHSLGLCEKLKHLYFHENPLMNYEMLRLEFEKGMKSFLWYLKNHYLIEKYQRKPPVIEYAHISINQEVNIVKDELISIIQQRLDVLKDKMLLNLQLLGIRELPKIMFQRKYCKIISKLRLDFNPKLVLTDEFVEKLSNLEMLSCKGCRLATFPENVFLWGSIVSLNLEENQLESIPEGIIELVNLNYLSKFIVICNFPFILIELTVRFVQKSIICNSCRSI
jgi:Leucine-rich repeat (LRR) protein